MTKLLIEKEKVENQELAVELRDLEKQKEILCQILMNKFIITVNQS